MLLAFGLVSRTPKQNRIQRKTGLLGGSTATPRGGSGSSSAWCSHLQQEPLVADNRRRVPVDDLGERQLPTVTQHHWHARSLRDAHREDPLQTQSERLLNHACVAAYRSG